MNKLEQLSAIDDCWAIQDEYASWVLPFLSTLNPIDVANASVQFEAASKADGGGMDEDLYEVINGVAVISLEGPMTRKPTSMSWYLGGASTIVKQRAIDLANQDKRVNSILLKIDSPGGQVNGLHELGAAVRASAKAVYAYNDDTTASAAYWVASQAKAVFARQGANTGSIGVMLVMQDTSAAYAQRGVKTMLFKTGKYKGMGTPGVEITPEQAAYMQARVDKLGAQFKSTVASGRGMAEEDVDSVADGRMFDTDEALASGLIDGVCSFAECIAKISNLSEGTTQTTPKPKKGSSSQASATSVAKDTSMTVTQKLMAFLRGQSTEALEEAGLEAADLAALETPDPSKTALETLRLEAESNRKEIEALKAQSERINVQALRSLANQFADKLIATNGDGLAKAVPAQREGIVAMFELAAKTDGHGKAVFAEDGSLITGESMKAFQAMWNDQQFHRLGATEIRNSNPTGQSDVDSGRVMGMINRSSRLSSETKKKIAAKMEGK